jgi:hypothetical protein
LYPFCFYLEDFRDWIVSALMKWVTTENSLRSEEEPPASSMPLDRLPGIIGAGWVETAMGADPGRKACFVQPDQKQQNRFHGWELILSKAARNKLSSFAASERVNDFLTDIHRSQGWTSCCRE